MLTTNMQTALHILHRDMIILKRDLLSRLIDAACLCFIIFIIFGHILPTLGMQQHLIAPLFLGSFANIFVSFGFSVATTLLFDIKNRGKLFYLMTLPLSLPWLFATMIVSFVIQVTSIILPTIAIGTMLLGAKFQTIKTDWVSFAMVYTLSALFFGILMTTCAIHYTTDWFLDNLWPRRLSPMFCFGCTNFLWMTLCSQKPLIAQCMLINPLVYVMEGLRSSLIGGDMFISSWICVAMLGFFCLIGSWLLMISVYKKLDPV